MTEILSLQGRRAEGWMGESKDHLFRNCVTLRGKEPRELTSWLFPEDPEAHLDICGMCLHRYERLSESKKDWLGKP